MRIPKQVTSLRRPRQKPSGVPHRPRPAHNRRRPLHVTLRRADLLPSMREEALFLALRRAFSRAQRAWFRVVQFSVQSNHVHMMVEARDKNSLARGITGLTVRMARAFNQALQRRGSVWEGRYHSRALSTPREVRNVLVYVLMNRRKHGAPTRGDENGGLDPCSSARWFDGWVHPPSCRPLHAEVPPVVPPETWLAATGWKRHGLMGLHESPRMKHA